MVYAALDGLCHRNNSTAIAMKSQRKLGDDYCRSNTLAFMALFIYSVELWRYQAVANMTMCPINMTMCSCDTALLVWLKMMVKCSTTKQKVFSIQLLAQSQYEHLGISNGFTIERHHVH